MPGLFLEEWFTAQIDDIHVCQQALTVEQVIWLIRGAGPVGSL